MARPKNPKRNAAKPRTDASGSNCGCELNPQEIATRAYIIWEKSGKPTGRDREHWIQAEAELQAEYKTFHKTVCDPSVEK